MLELLNSNFRNTVKSFSSLLTYNTSDYFSAYQTQNLVTDSDGNFYLAQTQASNKTNGYIFSFDKNFEFRFAKLVKDMGTSLIDKPGLKSLSVDSNNRIHIHGYKNWRTTNYNDCDSFIIILNQDGSVYKNLGYTDNPSSNYLGGNCGCVTDNYSIAAGLKWSTDYDNARPHIFIFDKLGNLQKSLWSNTSTTFSEINTIFRVPNTDECILLKSSSNRVINYDVANNLIKFNISLSSFSGKSPDYIQFDSSGNMYLIGTLSSNTNLFQVVKLDASRNISWSCSYSKKTRGNDGNSVFGACLNESTLYLCSHSSEDSYRSLLMIDCETGNIKQQFKTTTAIMRGSVFYDNSINFFTVYSGNNIFLTKLSLDDIKNFNNIKIDRFFNFEKDDDYTSNNIICSLTNHSDILFTPASYLTSTQFNISNLSLVDSKKFLGTEFK